jgi:hypothetical protein
VTDTGSREPTQDALLVGLAAAESDPTDIDTFERYVWQTKQAVRLWLTCLSHADGRNSQELWIGVSRDLLITS